MTVNVYNLKNESVGTTDLPETIFAVPWNPDLAHRVYEIQRSNARVPYAHVKDRSEVKGGGRKPWRQKGTGRARHGSIRSPIWKGGGVTHGPTKFKNYTRKINRKEKQQALFTILSKKLTDRHLKIIDSFKLPEAKTKLVVAFLNNFPENAKISAVIIPTKDNKILSRASRNLPKIKTISPESLNAVDLLNHRDVFIDQHAVKTIAAHYSK